MPLSFIYMLATATWLQYDLVVFCRYDTGKGRIRYLARGRGASNRAAFLFHCIFSTRARLFHCEPLIEWPVER